MKPKPRILIADDHAIVRRGLKETLEEELGDLLLQVVFHCQLAQERGAFDFEDAARHLDTLVARLAEDGTDPGPDAFARCGSLVVALAEHEDPWFTEVAATIDQRDVGVCEITADEARALFPPLGSLWRALHNPTAARVDGRRLCAALRRGAVRRGVSLHAMEVTGFECRGDRVTAVVGAGDTVPCGTVVIAGGAWSPAAAHLLGVDLPVTPTKGQIVHVALPATGGAGAGHGAGSSWPIVQPILNFYLVPWPGGRVACGGTFEADAGFDTRVTAGGVRDLLRECVSIAPGLVDATFLEVRVGLRPTSADDRPLLGPLPGWANVHVCTGHGANGLLLGPYSGAVVAAGIVGSPGTALHTYPAERVARP
jgi:D-amino-acid dehydrogenase